MQPADPAAQALAAFERGAVSELAARACVAVRGAERAEFVNRMCTNDARKVGPARGVAAALTTAKGRIVDVVRIFARGDAIVLLGSEGQGRRLLEWLQKYVVMEELAFDDLAARDGVLSVVGPGAEAAVRSVLGAAPGPSAGSFGVAEAAFGGATVTVLGRGEPPFHAIELLAPTGDAEGLRAALVSAGLAPIGEPAWEQVRVELGIPRHGRELTEHVNPLEVNLTAAVSFEKGCYIGQEVVARLNSYSKVQRHLVGIRFPESVGPADVKEVFWDLLRIGHATSAARSPRLGATLALALVKSEYTKPGTPVYTVKGGEHLHGTLSELPFR